jgi:hypothetical protein
VRRLAWFVALLAVASCGDPSAALLVELAGTPRALPLVFHGNCFAGYTVEASLRVRETEGVPVVLESLEFRFRDENQVDAGGDRLDSAALQERFGAEALNVPSGGVRDLPLSWRFDSEGRPASSPPAVLTLTGRIQAKDESDRRLSAPYSLTSRVDVVPYVHEPGGACPPPT